MMRQGSSYACDALPLTDRIANRKWASQSVLKPAGCRSAALRALGKDGVVQAVLTFLLPKDLVPALPRFRLQEQPFLALVFHEDAWWADLAAKGLKVVAQARPKKGRIDHSSQTPGDNSKTPGELLWQLLKDGEWRLPGIGEKELVVKDFREYMAFLKYLCSIRASSCTREHCCPCTMVLGLPMNHPQCDSVAVKFLCTLCLSPAEVKQALVATDEHSNDDYGSAVASSMAGTVAIPGFQNFRLQLEAVDYGEDDSDLKIEIGVCLYDAEWVPPESRSCIAVDLYALSESGKPLFEASRFSGYDDGCLNKICGGSIPIKDMLPSEVEGVSLPESPTTHLEAACANGLTLRCVVVLWTWEV